jgi:hypothetical protein
MSFHLPAHKQCSETIRPTGAFGKGAAESVASAETVPTPAPKNLGPSEKLEGNSPFGMVATDKKALWGEHLG